MKQVYLNDIRRQSHDPGQSNTVQKERTKHFFLSWQLTNALAVYVIPLRVLQLWNFL
jgi:hypothetical protein